MAMEDVYNMDEMGLFSRANLNKTQRQGKGRGHNSKGLSHSCSCCNHDMH